MSATSTIGGIRKTFKQKGEISHEKCSQNTFTVQRRQLFFTSPKIPLKSDFT